MNQTKPTKNLQKNLVTAARAANGTDIFRRIYVVNPNQTQADVANDGELSCAFFVSGILAIFGLIDHAHATTATTLERMQQAGWHTIAAPMPGAVVHWPTINGHDHIGFCLSDSEFISNSQFEHAPVIHGPQLQDSRQIDAVYWHSSLGE